MPLTRQTLGCAATVLLLCAAAALAAEPAANLLTLAKDPLLERALYRSPGRLINLKDIAPSGAVSVNIAWENHQGTTWYIEQQRGGADLVQAGVVLHDPRLIEQGLKILNWGFKLVGPDGGFPGTGDPHHSTSFFLEAASRSWLLLEEAGDLPHLQAIAAWKPKIGAIARWMIQPENVEKGRGAALDPYTHRFYVCAAGLAESAAITGDSAVRDYALYHAVDGLGRQEADGTNPEKGGFDVSYQAVGVVFASRYWTLCPEARTKAALAKMIQGALTKELTKIDAQGDVSLEGSTRVTSEVARSGKPKTMDYKMLVIALLNGEKVTGNRQFGAVAERIAQRQKWLGR